jgi:hypothetical protein
MDNNIAEAGLQNQQALLSELKNEETKVKRCKSFGLGCFIYALIYTICLYHNTSGISYPFFAAATVYFFGFYLRKSETKFNIENGGVAIRNFISDKFIMVSMLMIGFLNFTTDSWVLIFFNRCLMFMLLMTMVIGHWYDISGWSIFSHIRVWVTVICGSLVRIFMPFGDMVALKRARGDEEDCEAKNAHNKKIMSILIGLVISIPIAMLMCALLSSADVIFGQWISGMLSFKIDVDFSYNFVKIAVMILAVFGLSYGLIVFNLDSENRDKIIQKTSVRANKFDSYIAITVNAVVGVFYLIFSIIQIFGLFLGKMKLPEGYTYASYVHEGFYQLVFVCLFNIGLVLISLSHFEKSKILKVFLTIICGCTYIMTASSGYRMVLYIASYGLTFLRLFVLWALIVIALVMAGVTASIYKNGFETFKYVFVLVTVAWIAFSAMHPDYFIARYNLKYQDNPDTYYITYSLSCDALPALKNYAYDSLNNENIYSHLRYVASGYESELKEFLGFRKLNISRAYMLYLYKAGKI